jgi:hypothetical protein
LRHHATGRKTRETPIFVHPSMHLGTPKHRYKNNNDNDYQSSNIFMQQQIQVSSIRLSALKPTPLSKATRGLIG